jgi:hypothetical protein
MKYAPVCIFVYKRLESLKTVLESLSNNYLAKDTELFICSNSAVDDSEKEVVDAIRQYTSNVSGFKQVRVIINEINKGGPEHAIKNITNIITKYKRIIVLNDDDVPTKNFLNFMNDALEHYEKKTSVLMIGAYAFPVPEKYFSDNDMCYIPRPCTWGFGIWLDRWINVLNCNPTIKDIRQTNWFRYNRAGYDLFNISVSDIAKDAKFDVKLIYAMYTDKLLTVFPKKSFITNIGFDGMGVNCRAEDKDKYIPSLINEEKTDFSFTDQIVVNKAILRYYRRKYGSLFYYFFDRFPSLAHSLGKLKRWLRKALNIK